MVLSALLQLGEDRIPPIHSGRAPLDKGNFYLTYRANHLGAEGPSLTSVPGITTFVVGTVAALVLYGGCVVLLGRGFPRRLVLGASLVWIAGWIAVVPSTTAGPRWLSYATAVGIGSLLAGTAATIRLLDWDDGQVQGEPVATHLLASGGATAAPGAAGLLFGEEVLVLAFVVTVGVAVILLFLFR